MRKLKNPFLEWEGYNCFGCCPDNPYGLQLSFGEEDEEIFAVWEPRPQFAGYKGVLHGGIQATLMDEIASWVVYVKLKRAGVTSTMNVRYHKPVTIDGGPLTLRSKVTSMRRNLADIHTTVHNKEGELCSESTITYYTFSEKVSKESFFYPGEDAFIEKD